MIGALLRTYLMDTGRSDQCFVCSSTGETFAVFDPLIFVSIRFDFVVFDPSIFTFNNFDFDVVDGLTFTSLFMFFDNFPDVSCGAGLDWGVTANVGVTAVAGPSSLPPLLTTPP